jgi:hypothetical protein
MRRELRFLLGYYSPPDDEPSVDGFFVELVRDNMAVLTAAEQRGESLSARDCERLATALSNIGHAAEAMGYPVVKAALDDVCADLPGKRKAIAPKRRARILGKLPPAQALIRDMVCLAETGAI